MYRNWSILFNWLKGRGLLQLIFCPLPLLCSLLILKLLLRFSEVPGFGFVLLIYLAIPILALILCLGFLWSGLHLSWPWLAHRLTALSISFFIAILIVLIVGTAARFLLNLPFPDIFEMEFTDIVPLAVKYASKPALILLVIVVDVFVDFKLTLGGWHAKWTHNVLQDNGIIKSKEN